MTKGQIVKRLEELEARSMWEILPAYRWDTKTKIGKSCHASYYKGIKDMENAWHETLTELRKEAIR